MSDSKEKDVKRNVPKLRFPGFTDPWEQRKLGEVARRVTRKNTGNESDLPLTISAQNGLVDQRTFFNKQVASKDMSGYYLLHKGEFAYNKSTSNGNPWGAVKRLEMYEKGCVSTLYICFEPFDADSDWLCVYYETDYWHKEVRAIATEGARNHGLLNVSPDDFLQTRLLVPSSTAEQRAIGAFFADVDNLITLRQRELERTKELKRGLLQKMFPREGSDVPEIRFPGFTDPWEQRKLGDEFKKVNERNDGSFGREHWISVAKMYFQDPELVQSNNIDTRTYVMRKGDIAFEGHPNAEFAYGRFVANDIGDGVVSELFPVYRHIAEYDNDYWKHAIQIERIMAPLFAKSITSSGNSSNKLDSHHFLRQRIPVPSLSEQRAIGAFFRDIDHLITLRQRELDHVKLLKKALLQQMFV